MEKKLIALSRYLNKSGHTDLSKSIKNILKAASNKEYDSFLDRISMDDIDKDSGHYECHIKDATTGNCGKFVITLIAKMLPHLTEEKISSLALGIYSEYPIDSLDSAFDSVYIDGEKRDNEINHLFAKINDDLYDVSGKTSRDLIVSVYDNGYKDEGSFFFFDINSLEDLKISEDFVDDMGYKNNLGYITAVYENVLNKYFSHLFMVEK